MLVGDLVYDSWLGRIGIVLSKPRISLDCDNKALGTMTGDIYSVVEVVFNGETDICLFDDLEVLSAGR